LPFLSQGNDNKVPGTYFYHIKATDLPDSGMGPSKIDATSTRTLQQIQIL